MNPKFEKWLGNQRYIPYYLIMTDQYWWKILKSEYDWPINYTWEEIKKHPYI